MQLKKTERIYAMKVVKKELVNDDEVNGTSGSRTSTHAFKTQILVMVQAPACALTRDVSGF